MMPLERGAVRHFVYTVYDAERRHLYIGRSCNVRNRLKAHAGAPWMPEARDITMVGPFTWDQAVRAEREAIERHQPRGNQALTSRDHRPAVAVRSAGHAAPTDGRTERSAGSKRAS